MSKIAYIMIGVSGCGKSTLIRQLREDPKFATGDVRTFSLDSCRYGFAIKKIGLHDHIEDEATYAKCYQLAVDNQKEFDAYVNEQWAYSLGGDTLFIDNMNVSKKSRARWIADAKHKGFQVIAIQIQTPLKTLIERQKTRGDKSVPENVVRDAYFRQQEVLVPEEADLLFLVDGSIQNSTLEAIVHLE